MCRNGDVNSAINLPHLHGQLQLSQLSVSIIKTSILQYIAINKSSDSMPETNKDDVIAERQANLPLPEEPPVEPDWNSSDARPIDNEGLKQQSTQNMPSSTGSKDPTLANEATTD